MSNAEKFNIALKTMPEVIVRIAEMLRSGATAKESKKNREAVRRVSKILRILEAEAQQLEIEIHRMKRRGVL